ncbi:efflux RND transporter permease subunit [Sulfitobacter geojensis]|uniref:efflux RND transporter permease subunit n=1 Tax=Sulfitobacter geojensis TaxID=1342299 RepID=UPI00138E2D7F|nr:efflux RND transporter permease subunit [Sulfitobacter geojensis]NYI26355.1 hypothetical protein [Sulfitobacter geojensis]
MRNDQKSDARAHQHHRSKDMPRRLHLIRQSCKSGNTKGKHGDMDQGAGQQEETAKCDLDEKLGQISVPLFTARAALQAACNKTSEGGAHVKQILKAALLFTALAFPSFAQETARPAKVFTVMEETDQIVRRYPDRTSATAGGNRKPHHSARGRQPRRDRGIAGLTFATLLTLIVVPVLYTLFLRITPDEKPSAQ